MAMPGRKRPNLGINHSPGLLILCACLAFVLPSHASYISHISEIDLGGPAGRAIEMTLDQPDVDHTLLILNATPYRAADFGFVYDQIVIPAGTATLDVVMLSDDPWPGQPGLTTPLASLGSAAGRESITLGFNTLFMLVRGQSTLGHNVNPVTEPLVAQQHDPTSVTDWLVIGEDDLDAKYRESGYNLDTINDILGIQLLDRLVDKDSGRIIGRAATPEGDFDLNTFFVGTPDENAAFQVAPHLNYTYTPGIRNLPLLNTAPEPGTLPLLAAALLLAPYRRKRHTSRRHANRISWSATTSPPKIT